MTVYTESVTGGNHWNLLVGNLAALYRECGQGLSDNHLAIRYLAQDHINRVASLGLHQEAQSLKDLLQGKLNSIPLRMVVTHVLAHIISREEMGVARLLALECLGGKTVPSYDQLRKIAFYLGVTTSLSDTPPTPTALLEMTVSLLWGGGVPSESPLSPEERKVLVALLNGGPNQKVEVPSLLKWNLTKTPGIGQHLPLNQWTPFSIRRGAVFGDFICLQPTRLVVLRGRIVHQSGMACSDLGTFHQPTILAPGSIARLTGQAPLSIILLERAHTLIETGLPPNEAQELLYDLFPDEISALFSGLIQDLPKNSDQEKERRVQNLFRSLRVIQSNLDRRLKNQYELWLQQIRLRKEDPPPLYPAFVDFLTQYFEHSPLAAEVPAHEEDKPDLNSGTPLISCEIPQTKNLRLNELNAISKNVWDRSIFQALQRNPKEGDRLYLSTTRPKGIRYKEGDTTHDQMKLRGSLVLTQIPAEETLFPVIPLVWIDEQKRWIVEASGVGGVQSIRLLYQILQTPWGLGVRGKISTLLHRSPSPETPRMIHWIEERAK